MTEREEKMKNNNSPIKVINIFVYLICCSGYYKMRLFAPLSKHGHETENKMSANDFRFTMGKIESKRDTKVSCNDTTLHEFVFLQS